MGLGHWPLPYSPSIRVSLMLASGCQSQNIIADAAGPDTFTCEDLLRLLASAVGARVRLVHTPAFLGLAPTRLVGLLLRDVVLTKDEVDGLMAGLLTCSSEPTGCMRLAHWLYDNASGLEVWPESHWPGFALRQADVFQSYAGLCTKSTS